MQSSPRPRRFGIIVEGLLAIGVLAIIGLGVLVVNRPDAMTGATDTSQTGQADTTAIADAAIDSSSVPPASANTQLYPAPSTSPSSLPEPSPSILPATEPFVFGICDVRDTKIESFVRHTPTIVRGTVKKVLPAQWSTPNGRRPANPHAPESVGTIYRPVLIDVTEYLRGERPQRTLIVMARGGTVGQDIIQLCGGNDPRSTFREGEDVVLFLYPPELIWGPTLPAPAVGVPGAPFLAVWDRYTIMVDGQATNGSRMVPLQQLRQEIQAAISALPSASASPSVSP